MYHNLKRFCLLSFLLPLKTKQKTNANALCRALPGMRSTSRGASVEKSPSHKIPEQLRTPKVPQVDNNILSSSRSGKYCLSFTNALASLWQA